MRCWESPCLVRHVVLFSGSLMTLYSLSPHLVVRKRKQGTWHQSRDPSWGMVGPNDHDMIPSQVPPPNTIPLGLGFWGVNLEGSWLSVHNIVLWSVTCMQLHSPFCPVMWHNQDSNTREWRSSYFIASHFLQWNYLIFVILLTKMLSEVFMHFPL